MKEDKPQMPMVMYGWVLSCEASGKVLRLHTQGVDVNDVLSEVAKCVTSRDVVSKKLSCEIIRCNAARRPDLSLLVVNTLLRDLRDPDPSVRVLAVRALSCCCASAGDAAERAALEATRDASAHFADVVVDRLYELVRDPDPIVVSNALAALDDALADEGGVAVNRSMVRHLAARLPEFSPWGAARVVATLSRYAPRSRDEAVDLMNACVVAAVELFLRLTAEVPGARADVWARAGAPLAAALATTDYETIAFVLAFLRRHADESLAPFRGRRRLRRRFFCRHNEPPYVKVAKLRLLPRLAADDASAAEIVDEVLPCCMDDDAAVAEAAAALLGDIAARFAGECRARVGDVFVRLLELRRPHVTRCVLAVARAWPLDDREFANRLAETAAAGMILGERGDAIDGAPYVLERLLEGFASSDAAGVALAFLTASVRLFLRRPAEMQDLLGRVMETCAASPHEPVRGRAILLYNLLKMDDDLELARKVVLGEIRDGGRDAVPAGFEDDSKATADLEDDSKATADLEDDSKATADLEDDSRGTASPKDA
ncbi:PREDICTED: AP-4 complex subunit beta-1-like [Priapulus caudatus]|uniref:AP-4 complex subunit beta-1-like n=1 Tax=Priapulus caudatus TaxID=37621 RepID=A0ABM1EXY9_PRICU|nr:PREDICTED: AP-4 complex subunit beta-1-like [Priapulus caudatus]